MSDYDAAPSGLTKEERDELALIFNKARWTKKDLARKAVLTTKLRLSNLSQDLKAK